MLISIGAVAEALRVSDNTVYQWIRREQLPAYQFGQHLSCDRAELLEWATSHHLALSARALAGTLPEPGPSLVDALRGGGVHRRIGGEDAAQVKRAIVDVLNLPSAVDEALLLARDALGAIAVNDGVAIPRVLSPIVVPGRAPLAVLCVLDTPLDLRAEDGRPVVALFAITAPSVRSHLRVLARLTGVLSVPGVRQAVLDHPDPEALIEVLVVAEARLLAASEAGA